MIETAKGETIIIKHDCNLPRPYSLGFRVQGSNGLWEVDGNRIYVEGKSDPHQWDVADEWLKKYDHPLWKKYGEHAQGAGHGGIAALRLLNPTSDQIFYTYMGIILN